ncbi:pyridoxamine 5'-phosphate oxidase family protein [Tautonia sp. JC769]|uniref:pyridoxamine 5'-phosphate oxidase family protein n=1 Tax=Tautonia sp. JC769 TaxID=3232135 RepID=UPI003459E895
MTEIPWRIAIERALTVHHGAPPSRWLQLATVAADGWPSVRTVVFRGFLGDGPILRFTTDLRSAKVAQIDRDSRAEACWMFTETREQFRLAGHLRLIGPDEADPPLVAERSEVWTALPPATRISLLWPEPGAPRADLRRFKVGTPDPHEPPPSFALLLLDPERVDHLDLRAEPHSRVQYQRLGGADEPIEWASLAVNP